MIGGPLISNAQVPAIGGIVEEDQFKVTAIPEKWKMKAPVIIGMKEEYLFKRLVTRGRVTASVHINEFVRKRIRLQDKMPLRNFQPLLCYHRQRRKRYVPGDQASDGKVVDIDMKNAIEEEQDIPDIYKPIYYKMKVKSMKIAIPDLEPGDIVDYN